MRYSLYINQVKALEWDINLKEAAVFSLLYELPSWAESVTLDDGVYFWASKKRLAQEVPIVSTKLDTIYRHISVLESKGLVRKFRYEFRDYYQITPLGKTWNSTDEAPGEEFGNKSDEDGEISEEFGNKSDEDGEISEEFGNKSGGIGGTSEEVGSNSDSVGEISEEDRKNVRNNSEEFPTYKYTSNTYTNINLLEFSDSIDRDAMVAFVDHRQAGKSELTQLAFDRSMRVALDASSIDMTPEDAIAKTIAMGRKGINLDKLKKPILVPGADGVFSDGEFFTNGKLRWTEGDMVAAVYMADRLEVVTERVDPKREKILKHWAHEMRIFREQEGMSHREILEPFLWATNDTFWKTIVLDPASLRKNINQLLAKTKLAKTKGDNATNGKHEQAASHNSERQKYLDDIRSANEGGGEEGDDIEGEFEDV